MTRVAMILLGATALLLGAGCPPSAVGGCDKDTDCKGERICVQRACVDPEGDAVAPLPPPVPPPPPVSPVPGPPPVVEPRPTTPPTPAPQPTSPVPDPSSGQVHSGDPPPARGKCGCAPDDLMCNLRCSSQKNPSRPRFPEPSPPGPQPF